MDKLLSRDEFRTRTLSRNGGECVAPGCSERAVDAHHVLNRNLFTEPEERGGYFLANGAGLCAVHHLDAEATLISCEALYEACSESRLLPKGWDDSLSYDTWGNVVVSEYERVPGPLFDNEGWQRLMRRYNLAWLFRGHS